MIHAKKGIQKSAKLVTDEKEGLAILRDCLKIANYYVRYRDLSEILRTNLLTQAAKSQSHQTWKQDLPKWNQTKAHLEDCFALTQKGVVGEKMRQLELIRRVES